MSIRFNLCAKIEVSLDKGIFKKLYRRKNGLIQKRTSKLFSRGIRLSYFFCRACSLSLFQQGQMCKYNFNAFQTLLSAAVKNIRRKYMTERRTPLSLYQYDGVQDLGYFDVLFCCLVLDKRDLSARVLTLCIQRYSRVLKYSSTGICNVPFCLKFASFKTVQSQTIRLTIQPTKYTEALEPSSRSH